MLLGDPAGAGGECRDVGGAVTCFEFVDGELFVGQGIRFGALVIHFEHAGVDLVECLLRKIGQPEAVPLFVDVERDTYRFGTARRKILFRCGTGDELVDQVGLLRNNSSIDPMLAATTARVSAKSTCEPSLRVLRAVTVRASTAAASVCGWIPVVEGCRFPGRAGGAVCVLWRCR